ncbi:actin nucleation-promoting factor WASL-like [Lates calcarifer]|uniref:Actin nucleation-promoting factor WASL-like n=1 Tax=Lates calcarifer TaxID=8187 RepID=A0AAJ8B8I0_LATCA|nr:actin nucleation-promoting factor WASL-like [Lates calcarifer]
MRCLTVLVAISGRCIRQFHKEVMEEIERGKRDWADGFEDIKLKYFGDSGEGIGVMTASLQSMSPDMATMPMQESLPPPPSHPPPPPPQSTTIPAPSPQPYPPASQSDVSPSSSPPAVAQDGISNNNQCVEQKTLKNSLEDNAQGNVKASEQITSNEAVVCNGKSSEHDQSLATETVQHTNGIAKAETTQTTAESSGLDPVKDVSPVTVKIIEEPHVDKPQRRDEPTEDSIKVIYELKEFSNEEIIRYIDRSFAFWKEKEAELFDI